MKPVASLAHLLSGGRNRPGWQRYLCATFWAAIAFLTRWSLHPVLGMETRFGFFIVFVLLVAWRSGVGPSLWTAAVSLSAIFLFFADGLTDNSVASVILLVIANYVAPAFFGIFLIESLHRSRMTAEAEAEHRRRAEAELDKARNQLRDYAIDLEKTVQVRTSELNEAVGFLENFCYSIAHDLRAPLRAMSGFCQILEGEHASSLDEEGRRYFARIRDASTRMDRLITSLLDYGRLNHVPLQLRPIDLNKAASEALASLQAELDAAHTSIHVQEDLGSVFADATLLTAALREVIQNAMQFRRPGQPLHVRIEVSTHDHIARLWIRDNGVGIAEAYMQKVFGLFQTLKEPESRHIGFGLAFVAKAVERMHGAVGVESKPGEGSAFWLDLPREDWRRSVRARPERALEMPRG